MNSTTKVFGLGLSKTGTTSLGDALNMLGIKTIHYPYDNQTFQELSNGNFDLSVLKEFQGVVDITVAPYYPQLDKVYPGSKFILTVRALEPWLASVKKHREVMNKRKNMNPESRRFHEFIRAVVYGILEFNIDRHTYVYETHLRNVLTYFKDRPNDLLVIDICGGEGWEKLCAFLNVSPIEYPFPHSNKRMNLFLEVAKEIYEVIPPKSTFILVDENFFGGDVSNDRTFIPFTEKEGVYWGLPSDSEAAIGEFERQVIQYKPQYLVFAQSSFWWFDYYSAFYTYLRKKYQCIMENDIVVILNLQDFNE